MDVIVWQSTSLVQAEISQPLLDGLHEMLYRDLYPFHQAASTAKNFRLIFWSNTCKPNDVPSDPTLLSVYRPNIHILAMSLLAC